MRNGRLDVLARITSHARGTVDVAYHAGGRTLRFKAPIQRGRIRVRPTAAAAAAPGQRHRDRALGGSATARPASFRLRAASLRAGLRGETAARAGGYPNIQVTGFRRARSGPMQGEQDGITIGEG